MATARKRVLDTRAIRVSFGLDAREWSQVLGVNDSTVYRWEQALGGATCVDPFQEQLMRAADGLPKRERLAIGEELRYLLAAGGPLRALHGLLRAIYGKVPRCPPKSKRRRNQKGK